MSEREWTHIQRRETTLESAGKRGRDDRRGSVKPGEDPAPVSPAPDRDAIRKGEELLERVKPY
jgi:hypothetical protein